jgi:hypothetical protein
VVRSQPLLSFIVTDGAAQRCRGPAQPRMVPPDDPLYVGGSAIAQSHGVGVLRRRCSRNHQFNRWRDEMRGSSASKERKAGQS